MVPTKSDHNKQLITLTVIKLSGFHCRYLPNSHKVNLLYTKEPLGMLAEPQLKNTELQYNNNNYYKNT